MKSKQIINRKPTAVSCIKCGIEREVLVVYTKSGKPMRQERSPFCGSCCASYSSRGLSLVDEYLQEQFSYYNPKGPYILKCDCGTEQTYTTKYSLVRVLQTTGKCGKCSRAMKREKWTLSEDDAKTRRLNSYNYVHKTNYTSVDQLPEPKEMSRYKDKCQKMSQTNLKRERPNDYRLYQENKYDGTDLGQLSIDHIKPLHECFEEGWSVRQASDISNLQLLTMKDNILKEQPNSVFVK